MRRAEESDKKLYMAAKWAQNPATATQTQATVPPLHSGDIIATTAEEKAEMLFQTYFPPPPTVDLTNIAGFSYPNPIEDGKPLRSREVRKAIKKTAPDKAPGPNGQPNRMIRQTAKLACEQIRSLFKRCLREGLQPAHFKRTATVLLRKPGNRDYTNPRSYRPIALLDTLEKTLESIVSDRIRYAIEMHATLPNTQMGARRQRSADTALQLITEKIHTV